MEIFDLSTLLTNPVALATVTGTVVAFLRANVLKGSGISTVLLAFIVSGALVALGIASQHFPQVVEILTLIIMGAVTAGGGVDVGRHVFGGDS